jgi:leader peptidase (prepilin peptidase)/N-methyltransferase
MFVNTYITELDLLLQKDGVRYIIAIILGLCIGSFLNVVIVRLPVILKHKWAKHSLEFLEQEFHTPPLSQLAANIHENSAVAQLSLAFPSSHCIHCQNKLKFWMNLPILSYIILQGKCYFCTTKISLFYPFIEFLTAFIFIVIAYLYKDFFHLLTYYIFASIVIVAAVIDCKTMLLPDEITLPLLWLGLIVNMQGFISGSLISSVLGAILGYGFLAIIYWTFKLLTKKEGMGFGDFKFLAAIGAWLGVNYIIPIAMISSCIAILYTVVLVIMARQKITQVVPFGPFLAIAAMLCVFGINYIQPLFRL